MRSKFITIAAVIFAGIASANAAQVRLDGAGFDVIYDSDALGLFGTPSLLGNTLVFSPTQFSADSNSLSWNLTNSTVIFTLEADAGYNLGGASLVEQGDYILLGNQAEAFVGGQTRALDSRTPQIDTPVGITGASLADLTTHDTVTVNWQATSMQTFAPGATEVHFTIQDLLAAKASNVGNLAFVEKKYAGLTISDFAIAPVPEPQTYAMFLAGLGLIGFARFRRSH
ncbi:MAG TPA: PEP-CTERM sorting domain-containing protein [Rhodocyclaceae bacterium]|nr:PEP-CTERM sorting domain-containing protein [Rhodocyclaceae bacterium]